MKRFLVLAMVLATSLTAASCSDSTGPLAALSGTYTLRSVNGSSSSPWLITTGGYTDQVYTSTISLDTQGNYSSTTTGFRTYLGSPPKPFTDYITGYWTLSGSTLTLVDTTFPQYPVYYDATVSGSTITIFDPLIGPEIYSK